MVMGYVHMYVCISTSVALFANLYLAIQWGALLIEADVCIIGFFKYVLLTVSCRKKPIHDKNISKWPQTQQSAEKPLHWSRIEFARISSLSRVEMSLEGDKHGVILFQPFALECDCFCFHMLICRKPFNANNTRWIWSVCIESAALNRMRFQFTSRKGASSLTFKRFPNELFYTSR